MKAVFSLLASLGVRSLRSLVIRTEVTKDQSGPIAVCQPPWIINKLVYNVLQMRSRS